eukprot:Clim_evm160s210 gene=Clim_evmTU160s210
MAPPQDQNSNGGAMDAAMDSVADIVPKVEEETYNTKTPKRGRRVLGWVKILLAISSFLFIVVMLIINLFTWIDLSKRLSAVSVECADISVQGFQLVNPNSNHLTLRAQLQVGNPGTQSLLLQETEVEVYDEITGHLVGTYKFPAFALGATSTSVVSTEADLRVLEPDLMASQLSKLYQGTDLHWRFRAVNVPTIVNSAMTLGATTFSGIDKVVVLQGGNESVFYARNLEFTAGTAHYVNISSTVLIDETMPYATLIDKVETTFDLEVEGRNGPGSRIKIGSITFPEIAFGVPRSFFENVTIQLMHISPVNAVSGSRQRVSNVPDYNEYVADLLGDLLAAREVTVHMVGPVAGFRASYFVGVVNSVLKLKLGSIDVKEILSGGQTVQDRQRGGVGTNKPLTNSNGLTIEDTTNLQSSDAGAALPVLIKSTTLESERSLLDMGAKPVNIYSDEDSAGTADENAILVTLNDPVWTKMTLAFRNVLNKHINYQFTRIRVHSVYPTGFNYDRADELAATSQDNNVPLLGVSLDECEAQSDFGSMVMAKGSTATLEPNAFGSVDFALTPQETDKCIRHRIDAACCALTYGGHDIQSIPLDVTMSFTMRYEAFAVPLSLRVTNLPMYCASNTVWFNNICQKRVRDTCFTAHHGQKCDAQTKIQLGPYGIISGGKSPDNDFNGIDRTDNENADATVNYNDLVFNGGVCDGQGNDQYGFGYLYPSDDCIDWANSGNATNLAGDGCYQNLDTLEVCGRCWIPESHFGVIPENATVCPQNVYRHYNIDPSAEADLTPGTKLDQRSAGLIDADSFVNQGIDQQCTRAGFPGLLQMGFYAWQTQYSGELPQDYMVPWRQITGMQDLYSGPGHAYNLSGGLFDAGDGLKVTGPMAYAVTMLAWSGIENRNAYASTGQMDMLLQGVDHTITYLMECSKRIEAAAEKQEGKNLVVMVGDPDFYHDVWERNEDIMKHLLNSDDEDDVLLANPLKPAADVAADVAAALTAAAMLYRQESYKTDLTEQMDNRALLLLDFAHTFPGVAADSFPSVAATYNNVDYKDEIAWALSWFRYADLGGTHQERINSLDSFYMGSLLNSENRPYHNLSWENKWLGVLAIQARARAEDSYIQSAVTQLTRWIYLHPDSETEQSLVNLIRAVPSRETDVENIPYTPGGLAYPVNFSPLSNVAAASFIANVIATQIEQENGGAGIAPGLRFWARNQFDYIIGQNPEGISLIVGYTEKYPLRLHHRGSSCPSDGTECDDSYLKSPTADLNPIYGMMTGGVKEDDAYSTLSREDYQLTEPTTHGQGAWIALLSSTIETCTA